MGAYDPVPNRAPKQKVLITNGDLGTDANWFGRWATATPQGMAAVRRAVDSHSDRHGKSAWAEAWTNPIDSGRGNDRVIYGTRS
jgi:hypothetical protein